MFLPLLLFLYPLSKDCALETPQSNSQRLKAEFDCFRRFGLKHKGSHYESFLDQISLLAGKEVLLWSVVTCLRDSGGTCSLGYL